MEARAVASRPLVHHYECLFQGPPARGEEHGVVRWKIAGILVGASRSKARAADASRGYAAASATDARARSDASTGFPGRGDGDASASRAVESAVAGAERDAASRADAGGLGAVDGIAHLSGHGPHRGR